VFSFLHGYIMTFIVMFNDDLLLWLNIDSQFDVISYFVLLFLLWWCFYMKIKSNHLLNINNV